MLCCTYILQYSIMVQNVMYPSLIHCCVCTVMFLKNTVFVGSEKGLSVLIVALQGERSHHKLIRR